MNNYQWLLQMDGAERKAWFDAEHTESPISDTMRHIGQVIEDTVKRGVYGDTEPENEDSRELLDADVRKWCGEYAYQADIVWTWLNRQAAITEEKTRYKWVTALAEEIAAWRSKAEKLKEQVYELTAERDNLKANNEQLHTLAGEQAAKIDELQAAFDAICANLSIIASGEPDVIADIAIETIDALIDECNTANRQCNEYRKKFGKCLDYADAIHALMDDEGMA